MGRCDKRAAVLQAALEAVAEHGFHGAPMAQIAERAAVGAGTIYRYFENKDALITASYQEIEGRFLAAVRDAYPDGKPVRVRFLHVATVTLRYFMTRPVEIRFLQQFHGSPYGTELRRERLFGQGDMDVIRDLFAEAREQQIVKELPLPVLFALAFGPLLNICRDHILGFLTLDDLLIGQTVEACWDSLRR